MKIRRRKYASGRTGWQLDLGKVNGRRVQVAFGTRDEADAELLRRKAELKRSGEQAFLITDEERIRYVAVRDRLAAVGATMEDAAEFYLTHAKPARGVIAFEVMFALCLEAKEEEGLSKRYRVQLSSSVGSFIKAGNGLRPANEITSEDVLAWLRSNQWEWKTWNNYRGDLRAVFEWGREKKYLSLNPCDGVVRKKRPGDLDDDPEFLTVEQVQALLDRAAEWHPGAQRRNEFGTWVPIDAGKECFLDCLAACVIGFFCGLRPEKEIGQMEWSHERGDVVVVTSGRAKTRGRRVVDLPENAREWLKLCPVREGKILPKNFRRKWRRLREEAGLFEGWPHDAIRHTFATMHMAFHRDEKLLQALLGHDDGDLIYSNYRGLETPANGARFWALRPRLWGSALLLKE